MQEIFVKTELLSSEEVARAAELLLMGELVAFPTETVYGLGAPLFAEESIEKIFSVKGRPSDNPLIAHVASLEEVEKIALDIPKEYYRLAESFSPGPLTVVLKRNDRVPERVSAGLPTIAIRIPRHPEAQALLELIGEPLVAPSANLSGKPSATSAEHVLEDFEGKIAAVLNGGECSFGLESTVLSLLDPEKPILMRPGAITQREIEAVLGRTLFLPNAETAVASPGMKYRHYAPNARLKLFESREILLRYLEEEVSCKRLVLTDEHFSKLPCEQRLLTASSLYSLLRFSDREGYEEVLVFCGEKTLQNSALMNRLHRASQ